MTRRDGPPGPLRRHAWIAFFLLTLPGLLSAAFPKPRGFVNDTAGVLDAKSRAEIDAMVRDVERQTSAEIALLTVSSLDGMTLEDYASRLFKEWGIGKKGVDNGVLILVATSQRKMRIEVGYGLEGILPDALAFEIIQKDFLPKFKTGDYAGGIRDGVRHVADVVRKNHVLTADERHELEARRRPPRLLMTSFLSLFVAVGAFMVGVGLRSKTGFPLLWGSIFGGVPFLMTLIPFVNAPPVVPGVLGAAMCFWGYRRGGSSRWLRELRQSGKGKGAPASGWVMGGKSWSSGGGSSGGGFGGGSSGGGGASGSW